MKSCILVLHGKEGVMAEEDTWILSSFSKKEKKYVIICGIGHLVSVSIEK